MTTGQHLFVYGTLRRDSRHDMYDLLARHASFVGDASFQGRLFLVEKFPGAIRSLDPSDSVRGEVYRLESPRAVLPRLDEYEDFDPGDPHGSLYRRELADVVLDDGRVVRAWLYLYNRPVDGLPRVSSGDYREMLRR